MIASTEKQAKLHLTLASEDEIKQNRQARLVSTADTPCAHAQRSAPKWVNRYHPSAIYNMAPSLIRFSRGFLVGSLLGSALLVFGLVAGSITHLLVAQLPGDVLAADKDDSTHAMYLLPIYVLVFGLGGGIIMLLEADRILSVRSILAWMVAIAVVLGGCSFIVSLAIIQASVEVTWGWGLAGGTALLFNTAWSLAVWRTTTNRDNVEPGDATDDGCM